MSSDNNRHKKARRACAVRALRTSLDDSGNHQWRNLGWQEFNPRPKFLHSYAGHLKTISYQLNQGAVVSRLHAITMVKTLCGQFVDQHEKLNLD